MSAELDTTGRLRRFHEWAGMVRDLERAIPALHSEHDVTMATVVEMQITRNGNAIVLRRLRRPCIISIRRTQRNYGRCVAIVHVRNGPLEP